MDSQPHIRVLVDTDGGVDDAAALWWLLTQDDVEIAGIVCTGSNRAVEVVLIAVQNVLDACGRRDVPIAIGHRSPASTNLKSGNRFHGEDGLGGRAKPPAGKFLQCNVNELWRGLRNHTDLIVLTLCPMTSLAEACRNFPEMVAQARVVAMAGAFRVPGNTTAAAESNVVRDPVSAVTVLSAAWREPPTFIGLDVTGRALIDEDLMREFSQANTSAARFLHDPLAHYRNGHCNLYGGRAFPCHDLLAAMSLRHPGLLSFENLPVAIDQGDSAGRGATIADERPLLHRDVEPPYFPARVATGVDLEMYRSLLLNLVNTEPNARNF